MNKFCLSLLALSALLLTSCATIFSGTQATIILDGDVQEPLTVTTPTDTLDSLSLPATINLLRRDLNKPLAYIVQLRLC